MTVVSEVSGISDFPSSTLARPPRARPAFVNFLNLGIWGAEKNGDGKSLT